mmetsp:Transcript_2118/g.3389  ORF Transcript_2118/g.3389 Transcript_2118/m.3389 type:complete len:88 (-) Transcript_2118:1245-1508(-)
MQTLTLSKTTFHLQLPRLSPGEMCCLQLLALKPNKKNEKSNPVRVSAWVSEQAQHENFQRIQETELDDKEVEEALVLIAKMESMQSN